MSFFETGCDCGSAVREDRPDFLQECTHLFHGLAAEARRSDTSLFAPIRWNLVVGRSETIMGSANLFALQDKTNKFYSKKTITAPLRLEFPVSRYLGERLPAERKILVR
jgi:hypothetical protein